MLVPSIFGRGMFDDFSGFGGFNDFSGFPFEGFKNSMGIMKTDIKDNDKEYELTVDMPGIRKKDVKAELSDGYLTISAASGCSNDKKDEDGRYIRRERHYGTSSRSFYVGNAVSQDDIKASFENGTLKLTIPKKEDKQLQDNRNYIRIE